MNVIKRLTNKLTEIKTSIIIYICRAIQSKYSKLSAVDKLIFVKNCYIILTSSIQALDSNFVIVEKST